MNRFVDFDADAEITEEDVDKEIISFRGFQAKYRLKHRRIASFCIMSWTIKSIRFFTKKEHLEHSFMVEVIYAYAANAYAASMYLEGLFYLSTREKITEVEMERSYSASIFKKLRRKLVDLEGKSRRVHL